MSISSGTGSGSSQGHKRKYVGIPKRCWCGEKLVTKTAKTESNPYRRYFRCTFAASNKLANDNHLFKWIDEGILEELEHLDVQTSSTERLIIQDIQENKVMLEKKVLQVQMEARKGLKIVTLVGFLGFIAMYAIIKGGF